jgi:hypothetical protein
MTDDEIVDRVERVLTGDLYPLRKLPETGARVIYTDRTLQTEDMVGRLGEVLSVDSEDSLVMVQFHDRRIGTRFCFMESLSLLE